MRNIKLVIEYDGKKYLGWQRLADSEKTIQGKIETVLSQMINEEIEIIGSGRTDAGTHAKGQVANFKTISNMTVEKMLSYLNGHLPNDIVIKAVTEVPERFHARYNAIGKKYSYYVWNDSVPTAVNRNYSYHFSQTLDLTQLTAACDKLIGKHDFVGFSSLKKTKKTTIRTIKDIKIEQEGKLLKFTFEADGFLYNMIRIMMGTLLEIGAGEMKLATIDEIFENKVRANAGMTVPANGLFLEEVYYKK